LPVAKLAGPGTNVALHPAVLQAMPVSGREMLDG